MHKCTLYDSHRVGRGFRPGDHGPDPPVSYGLAPLLILCCT